MKPQADLLGRLQQLSSRDRGWLMQQLSDSERAQLLSNLGAPEHVPNITGATLQEVQTVVAGEPRKGGSEMTFSRTEPRAMAALLKHEPAWIAAIALQDQDESWAREVLEGLPAAQRSEVERSRTQAFGEHLVRAVLRQVQERYQGEGTTTSAFDRLVERIGASRSKRRLTLQL